MLNRYLSKELGKGRSSDYTARMVEGIEPAITRLEATFSADSGQGSAGCEDVYSELGLQDPMYQESSMEAQDVSRVLDPLSNLSHIPS